MGTLAVCGFGAPARRALGELIARAKAHDRLATVTVVVPSNLVGLATRRRLSEESGLLNVRWTVLPRLAELMVSGAPGSADTARQSPATPAMIHEAARATLADHRTLLGPSAEHPSTVEAVLELRELLPTLTSLPTEGWGARVLEVVAAVDDRLGGVRTDAALCAQAATLVHAGAPSALDAGHVIAYLVDQPPPHELELLAALAAAGRLDAVVGATSDGPAVARRVEQLASLALSVERGEVPAPAAPGRVVVTPDPRSEVRQAVRTLLAHAERGTPLHRCAIVAPTRWPACAIAHAELERAGLAHHGANPRTLAHSVAGRLVSGFLAMDDRLDRVEVLAWMAGAPVVDREGAPVPLTWWTRLSARAGVVRGPRQWRQRLLRYAAEVADDRPADADACVALAEFVEELEQMLPVKKRRPWTEHVDALVAMLDRYLPPETRRGDWPDGELDSARLVRRAVEGLRLADEVGAPVPGPVFAEAVARALAVRGPRIGRYGDGVLVATLDEIIGLEFDVAVVVGMAEGICPPAAHDPVLLGAIDPEGSLTRRQTRRAEQRRRFDAALAGIDHLVCSVARVDPWRGRTNWPAPWLVELAGRAAGKVVGAEQLMGHAPRRSERWLTVVPSRSAQLADIAAATTDAELLAGSAWAWRLAGSLDAHPWLADEGIDRQIAAITARASDRFTAWDGLVGPEAMGRPITTAISPTSLERWATCPRQYLLENVLRVGVDDEPVDDDVLDPLDRGSLVHSVLETVIREQLDDPSLEPNSYQLRQRAFELLEDLCDRYEAAGRTGRGLPWELGRNHLRRELSRFLDADARFREDSALTPHLVEAPFGFENSPAVSLELEGFEPLHFRGFIDRIDVSADRTVALVTDYKTGKAMTEPEVTDGVRRGTKLQLPVYGLAARALVPEATEVRARYWYVSDRGAWHTREIVVDDTTMAQLRRSAGTIAEGISNGVFPARPGPISWDSFEHCRFCNYERVCPPDRLVAWQRKSADPAVEPVLRLQQEPADE